MGQAGIDSRGPGDLHASRPAPCAEEARQGEPGLQGAMQIEVNIHFC